MKDRFEIRFTIATDSVISEKTIQAIGKTIETIAKRYADKFDRLIEAATKELENKEVKKDE